MSNPFVQQASQALRAGNLQAAESLATRGLEIDQADSTALLILGGVCFRSDRYQEAAHYFRAVIEGDPNAAEAIQYLAESLRRMGEIVGALKFAERAEKLNPLSLDANYTAALCLVSLAQFREGLVRLERFCQARDLPIAKHYLAHCLIRTERPAEALPILEELRRREPASVKHVIMQGQALIALHRYTEAAACGREILAKLPDEPTANALVAQALTSEGRVEEAEQYILAALAATPEAAIPNSLYGTWLHQMGRFSEAEPYFDKALAADPYQALPLFLKSGSKKFSPEDEPEIARLEEYAKSERTNAYEKIALRFGLGKAYNDLGDLHQAFSNYDQAHALAFDYYRDDQRYDAVRMLDLTVRTKELFSRRFFKDWEPLDTTAETPLFVMGMIRSGTTLMEQILSSHPQVVGAGELKFWPDEAFRTLGPSTKDIDRLKLIDASQRYLDLLEARTKGASRVVDKMPTNWIYAGFIAAGLPGAKLIHLRRDPVDIALSIWMTYISDPPAFSSQKEHIVSMIRLHSDLARYWSEVLPPDRYLQVSYEELTADPAAVIPKVVEFCGLPWDEACLYPEKNEKFVSTPSLFRVRKPIDRKSVSKAEKYREYLGEFAELIES